MVGIYITDEVRFVSHESADPSCDNTQIHHNFTIPLNLYEACLNELYTNHVKL